MYSYWLITRFADFFCFSHIMMAPISCFVLCRMRQGVLFKHAKCSRSSSFYVTKSGCKLIRYLELSSKVERLLSSRNIPTAHRAPICAFEREKVKFRMVWSRSIWSYMSKSRAFDRGVSNLVPLLLNDGYVTRRIVDTPANEMNTDAFVAEVRRLGQELGVTCTVIQGEQLRYARGAASPTINQVESCA
jgi:hypothetical protein